MTEDMKEFEAYLEKHPKALDSMERKEELGHFKEEYKVDAKSKFHCPVCSEYMKLGRLYQSVDNPDTYVCKSCHCIVRLELLGPPEE